MTYEQWEAEAGGQIRGDTLGRVEAYRLGWFLSDLARADWGGLFRNRRTAEIAGQPSRAAGNISSSVAEGYSRDTGKARPTYHEYALGSAREARDWHFKARHVLKKDVASHRIELTAQVIRLSLKTIARERRSDRRASDPSSCFMSSGFTS